MRSHYHTKCSSFTSLKYYSFQHDLEQIGVSAPFRNASVALEIGLFTGDEACVHHFTPQTKQPRKKCGPVKEHFTDCRFHNNEKVDMAIREWLQMQRMISTLTEFSNSCRDGPNA